MSDLTERLRSETDLGECGRLCDEASARIMRLEAVFAAAGKYMQKPHFPLDNLAHDLLDALRNAGWEKQPLPSPPGAHLRCTVCGKIKPNDWGYLCSGWPKCCGYTMRLETKPDGEAKP